MRSWLLLFTITTKALWALPTEGSALNQLFYPTLQTYFDAEEEEPYRIKQTFSIAVGEHHPEVPRLRQRLSQLGDLPDTLPIDRFDAATRSALVQFQWRTGIPQTGEVDETTYIALNMPIESRKQQIQANLIRLEKFPISSHEKFLVVNVADFSLSAFQDNHLAFRMRVIAGQEGTETPIFQSAIESVILNPWWNIPGSIAEEEAIPEIKADPRVFETKQMQLWEKKKKKHRLVDTKKLDWETFEFDPEKHSLRQAPGKDNPLGPIKFVTPNTFEILIHGTSEPWKFNEGATKVSHGCIRVENPVRLAEWILADSKNKWSQEKISDLIEKKKTVETPLKKSIPVYFTYLTSWVDESGLLHFRNDPYGWDDWDGEIVSELKFSKDAPVFLSE